MFSNDVHIVLDPAAEPATRRKAYEAEMARRLLDDQKRHLADLAASDSFEQERDQVRRECAARYASLITHLEPYVDGTMGEVTAGLAAVYVAAVRQLGALYQSPGRRLPVASRPVLPEPAAVLSDEESAAAVAVAVEEKRVAVREQLLVARGKALQLEA